MPEWLLSLDSPHVVVPTHLETAGCGFEDCLTVAVLVPHRAALSSLEAAGCGCLETERPSHQPEAADRWGKVGTLDLRAEPSDYSSIVP